MRLVKPKKALGQHFLKDLQIAQRIANTLADYKGTPVLEIGPGMGVLTQFLLEEGHDLKVVELDSESVAYLEQNFPDLKGRIIAQDFLKLDLSQLYPDRFCVIGNYPYNISSQIFFKVLDYKEQIPCCSGMIQKEVAERLASAGKQGVRHHLRIAAGVVRHRISLHRQRTGIQSAAQSEKRGYPHDPQQPHRIRLRRKAVQDRCQNNLQPAAQDITEFHQADTGERFPGLPSPHLRQTSGATFGRTIHRADEIGEPLYNKGIKRQAQTNKSNVE